MAMVLCENCGPPTRAVHQFLNSVEPVGYPNKAVICCRRGCSEPGLVCLNEIDEACYDKGERELIL